MFPIQTWQNFYLLVGTAAATLVGLMFVAITFGSSLVTPETSATARSFLDPTFGHFVQVLLTACLVTIPSMGPALLGAMLIAIALARATVLVRVHAHMRLAQRRSNDIEISDWMTGVVIPLACYIALVVAGVAFIAGFSFAFAVLAASIVVILLNGIYGAWEMMVWMAVTRSKRTPS